MRSPFQAALDALARPMVFAARDGFAAADRVRDLEKTVRRSCQRLRELAVPKDVQVELEGIEAAFAEPLLGEARAGAVRDALQRIESWQRPEWSEHALARPLTWLPGIGPKRADTLARRGLESIADLLFHLPSRYDDRRNLVRVEDLEVGRHSTFIAEVQSTGASMVRMRGRHRRILEAVVGDDTGSVTLKWFRAGPALEALLKKGARLLVTGDVKRYRFSKELVHPEVEPVDSSDDLQESAEPLESEGVGRVNLDTLREIVPVYTTPDRVPPRTLRRLVAAALDQYADLLVGHLPQGLVEERGLPSAAQALRIVHTPPPDAEVDSYAQFASAGHQRLVLEELYLLELGLALRRSEAKKMPGIAVHSVGGRVERATDALPFRLTRAQARAWEEIRRDMVEPHPMNRLLQGDVGCGKTAVAYLAAVSAASSGFQSAVMAPTELLAEQHARTLSRLSGGMPEASRLRVGLLTASVPRHESEALRRAMSGGDVDLVVGTHALVQADVGFANLALAIVDEQHRFGVEQRAALAAKAAGELKPHVLVMTATPIPRTLALTLYGDLDLSVIDELPPGRSPVDTMLLRDGEGRRLAQLLREVADRGEQIYVVYPLVEKSEKMDLRSAMQSAERIAAAFPDLAVDLVHGRQSARERADAMDRFERGETRILVSTTVIEVGVDVPNATLMIVEHAERFGLAQLHQLRGRVGRGDQAGTCVLVARGGGESGEARLRAMLETTDGFAIADADLRIRGPGEFLGTRQHGVLPELRVADLLRDSRLLSAAREAALRAVREDPGLRGDALLRRAVEERWGHRLALAGVG